MDQVARVTRIRKGGNELRWNCLTIRGATADCITPPPPPSQRHMWPVPAAEHQTNLQLCLFPLQDPQSLPNTPPADPADAAGTDQTQRALRTVMLTNAACSPAGATMPAQPCIMMRAHTRNVTCTVGHSHLQDRANACSTEAAALNVSPGRPCNMASIKEVLSILHATTQDHLSPTLH